MSPGPGHPGKRILLIDDDIDFAESQAEFLHGHGYQVETATEFAQALALCKSSPPHMALIDLRLGHRSGLELLRILGEDFPDILCILMTGYAEVDSAVDAMRQGAADYLRKPVAPMELLQVLDRNRESLRLQAELKASQEQLNQATKMEALGTLAGGIAHDFNNILTAISGFAELAQRSTLPDTDVHRHVSEIFSASQRAAELVKQILTFTRQTDETRETMQLLDVVEDALKLLRPTLPSSLNIHISCNPQDSLVSADPIQMHQVLINLCTNAAQAVGHNIGDLWITIDDFDCPAPVPVGSRLLESGRYLKLTMRDTGRGIEPEHLQRIFDPFFTTSEVGEGTGMGLALVDSIISAHGGATAVASHPGEGATFTVYIPHADGSQPVTRQTAQAKLPHPGAGRVLVVDDEQMIRVFFEAVLDSSGYERVCCSSGLEALSTLAADPRGFDLVITDQTMPGMTGSELIGEISRLYPELPVILCSGNAQALDDSSRQQAGISAFLVKPVSVDELLSTVDQALRPQA
jgi:signal transduction histidine kinase